MTQPDLTISIVSFNTKDLLRDCLASIYKNSKGITFEGVVIDNGSSDGSAEMVAGEFPRIRLIKNRKNLFLTKAQNQAMHGARGRYFLILNSDTRILHGTLKTVVEFLNKHPKVGALGVKHLYPNGKIEQTCQRFTTPLIEFLDSNLLTNLIWRAWKKPQVLERIHYSNWDRTSSRYVQAVSYACLFAPTNLLRRIGYYDERFLLFFTENDLCLRIRKLGYSCYHLANASITHTRAQSLAHFKPHRTYRFYEQDMLKFYLKYFGRFWWLFLYLNSRLNRIYYLIEPALSGIRKFKDRYGKT